MEHMHTGMRREPPVANEPTHRMRGRRRRRPMMLMMPVMMLAPVCLYVVLVRRLGRIEAKIDELMTNGHPAP